MDNNRKEKMDRITAMLKEGVEQVFSSERYAEWLRVCSKFHHYSINNQILILMQAPHASQVAGYKAWQSLGRQVRRGEKGLLIIAPMKIRDTDAQEDEEKLLFKATTVFDIAQTDGEALPSIVDELSDNDSRYDDLIEKLIAFSPVPVRLRTDIPDSAYGYFSPSEKEICIREGISRQQKCKTLIHEIAHSICDADPKAKTDRETKEVRAESIAFCVCSGLNIDTSQYSFGYIAGWSSNRDIPELKNVMQDIKRVANQILSAVTVS